MQGVESESMGGLFPLARFVALLADGRVGGRKESEWGAFFWSLGFCVFLASCEGDFLPYCMVLSYLQPHVLEAEKARKRWGKGAVWLGVFAALGKKRGESSKLHRNTQTPSPRSGLFAFARILERQASLGPPPLASKPATSWFPEEKTSASRYVVVGGYGSWLAKRGGIG